ncbi:MAG: SRPBCC family protein [Fimbriimonadaceae bacterium]|nr:SRPBCC family protein [Fimbriimonadaceae bacterium]
MTTKTWQTLIDAPVERVWEFHRSADALRRLSPPGTRVELMSQDGAVRVGAVHRLRIRRFGLSVRWDARIERADPPSGFVDVALRSPFAHWRHDHEFVAQPGGRTLLVDRVDYALPFGFLGRVLDRLFVGRALDGMFSHRHAATRRELESLPTPVM